MAYGGMEAVKSKIGYYNNSVLVNYLDVIIHHKKNKNILM
jgi:hypothetical protein